MSLFSAARAFFLLHEPVVTLCCAMQADLEAANSSLLTKDQELAALDEKLKVSQFTILVMVYIREAVVVLGMDDSHSGMAQCHNERCLVSCFL